MIRLIVPAYLGRIEAASVSRGSRSPVDVPLLGVLRRPGIHAAGQFVQGGASGVAGSRLDRCPVAESVVSQAHALARAGDLQEARQVELRALELWDDAAAVPES